MENVKRKNPFKTAFQKLIKNKMATLCFFVLLIEILLVIFAPMITDYGYEEQDPALRLRPGFWGIHEEEAAQMENVKPGDIYAEGHLLGTDNFGRDILTRLLYGGRISLMVGFVSTAMGLAVGVLCGLLAGYYK